MPLASEDYYRLTQSGLNGVVCFQETYNRANYNIYHPAGMKSKFEWRVNGFDRMGQAGVHKIGMGVLIGLEEWRTDVTMMAGSKNRCRNLLEFHAFTQSCWLSQLDSCSAGEVPVTLMT